jgi:hypothetical protein
VDGTAVAALLPGMTCRSNVEVSSLSCVDDQQSWPLGIDNSGVDASRNFFSTPEGLPFFAAAPLAPEVASARWLIADAFGSLSFLDGSRRVIAAAGSGDDVVALAAACGGGVYAIVSRPRGSDDRGDALHVFRVVERQLVPAAPPIELSGVVTALWAEPGETLATAVTYDAHADRYEAFHIAVACDR